MAARSIATASISFGLVTVPVRIYPATRASAGLSFHLLHEKDHSRLKQQYICEKEGRVVSRSEMVKGAPFFAGGPVDGRWFLAPPVSVPRSYYTTVTSAPRRRC